MRRTLLAFSIATMALTTVADHLIVVKVGGKSFAAKIEDTATGRAFMEKLPLTLDMTELNGNEKYRYGVSLPTAAQYFAKLEADMQVFQACGKCRLKMSSHLSHFTYRRNDILLERCALAHRF